MSESAGKKGFGDKPQPKEEKPRKFQAIRGTRDLLPPETALWNRVELTAHEVFGTFGFGEIRLPDFESWELFVRSVGAETDIVNKEMYTFEDHGYGRAEQSKHVLEILNVSVDRPATVDTFLAEAKQYVQLIAEGVRSGEIPNHQSNLQRIELLKVALSFLEERIKAGLSVYPPDVFHSFVHNVRFMAFSIQLGSYVSLRPEATASVCRAYIEHNMQQLPQPVKLYYMGPMFRRERPQKGRYRQFYQIGAEVLGGSDAPAIDAEVIEMVMTFFERLELPGVQLDINSIGHAADNCRRGYVQKLKAELEKVKDKLGADSQRRIETNPLRVLDSKLEHEQPIIEKLPRIADHLCDDCKAHYAAVKQQLDLRGVKYHENWRLVRGLDYYMRTTFEITAKGLGSQNAVCGGGRYDGLVELLGGPPTKGIGFAIGEDRLILSLQEGTSSLSASAKAVVQQGRDVYIAWMGERALATAIRAAKNLRQVGFSVELPPVELKFGKALGQADKLGAKYALILGDNEVASGEWTLKTLASGEQLKLSEANLVEHLRKAGS